MNPCGMVMDFLRSCHRRNAVMFANDGTPVTIRWYFCAPGARPFPALHAFGSTVWEYPESLRPSLGESDFTLTWDKGHNPGYPGLRFQGAISWFQEGIPPDVQVLPFTQTLCGRPTVWANGGIEFDGAALVAYYVPGSGGIEFDGTAEWSTTVPVTGSGGIEFGGSALIEGMGGVIGEGGIEFDGAASFGAGIAGSGGIEFGGSGYMSGGEINGEGGIEFGGEADIAVLIGP
jgi:hypothetical protein